MTASSSKVQTLLFNRSLWTVSKAKAWAKEQVLAAIRKHADRATGLAEIAAVVRACKSLSIFTVHETLIELRERDVVELREWSSADLASAADKARMIRLPQGRLAGYVNLKAARNPSTAGVDRAKRLGAKLGVKWSASRFTPADLLEGIEVELEHKDVTKGALEPTAKIALAHLRECPSYYKKLRAMERRCR